MPHDQDHPDRPARRPLVVVSNRLPVSLTATRRGFERRKSAGGLAAALGGVSKDADFQWIGWPGTSIPAGQEQVVADLLAEDHLIPVKLAPEQIDLYYDGFANAVLWPLFHYFTTHVAFDLRAWRCYQDVNRAFAEAVAERAPAGALVWIHDFHLMLVPALLRERRPDVGIGFFLHVPFPSSEIYRLLPCREELLAGILGADYIGFHTHDYARHFRSSCLRILGLESSPVHVAHAGRQVGIGADPIGIDVEGFQDLLHRDETRRLLGSLAQRYAGRKLVLGVERLDYTKGVPQKLRAFERFLERDRARARSVTLLQILVPSRLAHPDYQDLKRTIEEDVGRINGRYGVPGTTPVEYMHRGVSPEELTALYRFADVGLVTPLRDGMNLVAQEYVLCQGTPVDGLPDGEGVLVLSEFAGAAHNLARSILVNPWDVEKTCDALEAALGMSVREKRERMAPMARHVEAMGCREWAARFLGRLARHSTGNEPAHEARPVQAAAAAELRRAFAGAAHRVLFLDYDGTLRELTRSPEAARPTTEILELLNRLGALPDTDVHLVSGRPRYDVEAWFASVPIHLCAEHGYTWRTAGGAWNVGAGVDLSWMPHVRRVLEETAADVPGTLVEEKSCGLAWHYRMADLDYGAWRARELLNSLEHDLAHHPAEVLQGHRVVEVRAAGVSKGRYVERMLEQAPADAFLLCIGDDRTDLDMYRALPRRAVRIHVGAPAEEAEFMLDAPARVREFLHDLAGALPRTHGAASAGGAG